MASPSDVFALGSLLVFAATSRLAFGDGAPLAILHRVVNNEPDLSGVAEDDSVLRRLIEGCLAKEPDDRPTPEHIIETFGTTEWPPLAGVAWEQPPLGVGLPLTASESADQPTVALTPRRGGGRIAVISAATVAALILATIAVVESSGNGKDTPAADTQHSSSASSSGQSGGAAFPPTDSSAGSSGSSGQTPTSGGPSPTPNGSVTAVKPGGGPATAPSQGSSQAVTITVPASGPSTGGGTSTGGVPASHPASTTSKPVSHPSTHPTTAPPPQPIHNPPAPMGAGDIKVQIPNWAGMATVDLSWPARSDATGYKLHYTVKGTGMNTDQTVPVSGTSYSYQIPADGTTCLQLQNVNQYGASAFYPSPMYCVNSFGTVTSGG